MLKFIIILLFQILGGILTLRHFCKDGTMSELVHNPPRFIEGTETPAGLVFLCLTSWEIFVIVNLVSIIANKINKFFESRF